MKKYIIALATAILVLCSCEKSFEVKDSSVLTGSAATKMVENDPSFLLSYVNGMYAYMVQFNTQGASADRAPHDDYGFLSVTHNVDLGGQDMAINGTLNWGTYDIPHGYGGYEYAHTYHYWNFFFTMIAKANEIIDFFGEEDPSDESLKGYLGQAYAVRGFAYTYLFYYFQDPVSGTSPTAKLETGRAAVPIIYASRDAKSADESDAKAGRNTLADIMEEIERNFSLADALLANYQRGSKNEIDASVLNGVKDRYYLITQQWEKARVAAVAAQSGYTVMPRASVLKNGFMEVNDGEVMWGFNHSTETQSAYASFFSHMCNDASGYGGVGQSVHCIDKALYDQIPVSDIRKGLWNTADGDPTAATTGAKIPYASRKFGYMPDWLEDYLYMRVEEMILIEAECEVRANSGAKAATALSKLMRQRDVTWAETEVTLDDVLLQRRIELWGEGFEFMDIRRNGLGIDRKYQGSNHLVANQFTFPAHDLSWNFQIPLSELQNNTHITEEENNEYVDPTA